MIKDKLEALTVFVEIVLNIFDYSGRWRREWHLRLMQSTCTGA
jgi:hypothetical protein